MFFYKEEAENNGSGNPVNIVSIYYDTNADTYSITGSGFSSISGDLFVNVLNIWGSINYIPEAPTVVNDGLIVGTLPVSELMNLGIDYSLPLRFEIEEAETGLFLGSYMNDNPLVPPATELAISSITISKTASTILNYSINFYDISAISDVYIYGTSISYGLAPNGPTISTDPRVSNAVVSSNQLSFNFDISIDAHREFGSTINQYLEIRGNSGGNIIYTTRMFTLTNIGDYNTESY